VFAIAGWVPRGDLAPQPKANGSGQQPQSTPGNVAPWTVAPSTGAQPKAAPQAQPSLADDFG